MRAFITGIGGFAGRHLTRHLRAAGDEVSGLVRGPEEVAADPSIPVTVADVLDEAAVAAAVSAARPDVIYHLAGFASVSDSWQKRRQALEVNLIGALSVLEAARAQASPPRVLLIGSAEQYAPREDGEALDEDAPQGPITPYGVSKAAQELLGLQYARAEGLPVVLVRAFNHTGPGQPLGFVIPDWAQRIAEIEVGQRKPVLEVGNLEALRDFTDVRDIVELYRLVAEKGRVGVVYNACSGVAWPLAEVLQRFELLARVRFEVRRRPPGPRRADMPVLLGSNQRARRELGWTPCITLDETLRDVLDYCRERVAAGG